MNQRIRFLVTFVLALYIVPMISLGNYAYLPTLEQQNIDKDFIPSDTGWFTGWSWRRNISIVGVSGCGTNYPINFTTPFYEDMQPDFDDVRFTDNDGITELDFWLEEYTASTSAKFWVEVADNLDSNQIIYMYYGNDAVSTTSDGTEVFYFFDNFEDNNLANNWFSVGSCWSSSTTQAKHGTYSAFGDSSGPSGRSLTQNYNVTTDAMFHTWVYIEDGVSTGYENYVFHSSSGYIAYTYEDDLSHNDGSPQTYITSCFTTGVWYEIEIAYHDGVVTDTLTGYLDGIEGNQVSSGVQSSYLQTRIQTDSDTNHDFYVDDWYIRNWNNLGEPTSTISEEVEHEMLWHTVETQPITIDLWEGISEASQWLINSILIIGGLVLIPASTLYLVKGGKNDIDTDKLFYFCIAFMFGWALLIGGILS